MNVRATTTRALKGGAGRDRLRPWIMDLESKRRPSVRPQNGDVVLVQSMARMGSFESDWRVRTLTVAERVNLRWRGVRKAGWLLTGPGLLFGCLQDLECWWLLNGHQTNLARMSSLTFQQSWCREKTSAFAMAPSFTWDGARRETCVIDSTWNQVSAQSGIAIVQLVCILTLLTLFAQNSSGAFKSQSKRRSAAIVRTTQLRPHCTIRRRNTSLHVIACRVHCTFSRHQLPVEYKCHYFRVSFDDRLTGPGELFLESLEEFIISLSE
jgi:hypothetical protein